MATSQPTGEEGAQDHTQGALKLLGACAFGRVVPLSELLDPHLSKAPEVRLAVFSGRAK